MVAMFTFRIDHYRWYDDDGGEAASTALQTEDTALDLTTNTNQSVQLRFLLQETGGADGNAMDDYQLEYSKNGGTSTAVPTADGGDGISAATAGLTNNNATTNRGTDGLSDGSGSFIAGEQSTDGLIDDHALTTGNFTEHVYGLTFYTANLANNDSFTFTITGPLKATDAVTATLTIDKADVLLADDVESASELTSPAVGQEHALLADDVESASELTTPAANEVNNLLANDVESASELTTPAVGQEHALLADDVQSTSELTAPVLAEVGGSVDNLLADDVESASEVTAPALAEIATEEAGVGTGGPGSYNATTSERERKKLKKHAEKIQAILNEMDRAKNPEQKEKAEEKAERIEKQVAKAIGPLLDMPEFEPIELPERQSDVRQRLETAHMEINMMLEAANNDAAAVLLLAS